jgi:hypothetical protein
MLWTQTEASQRVVKTKRVEQVMKLAFTNLAEILVNLDVQVNERQVPLNQNSKLNHELIGLITWKLGSKYFVWTPPEGVSIRAGKLQSKFPKAHNQICRDSTLISELVGLAFYGFGDRS